MRILWILPYLPWPTTSGGKTRQYHLLRSLAEAGHRITLLVQSKTPLDEDGRRHLEPLLERLIVLPRRPLRNPVTLAAVLFAPYPMLATVNGLAPELEQRFDALLGETWDVIQVEHSYTFQPFERGLRKHRKGFLITEHNVESGLGAATYDRLPGWMAPFARYDQWRYRRWERRVLSQAQRVVAVTDADARELAQLSGRPTDVVVNGVDCRYYAEVAPDANARRLFFIGNFEYAPNVDAVTWALDEIMPALWQRHPDVQISIAGFALPAEWRQRWPDSRIHWQGFLPDLRDEQRHTSLFVAPLRQGGGSKLKVLEAMAAGLPVVTTGQGASGLKVTPDVHYAHAETTEAFVERLATLLADPAHAARLGEAGRAYVRAEHDWSAAARELETIYTRLASPVGAPA
ncbi:MAG: D-inositol-3-phosphate glycosyltransferase [Stenotrophomonas maltophilia]|nr:MAG: D-inositol-3-phosphate glycosyltransferase [Stenotrophomonas maltophilia]